MDKSTKKEQVSTFEKVNELSFTAKLIMDSFYDEEKKVERRFPSIKLKHPFDPDEDDLTLSFNSDKYKDEGGRPKKDKVKSIFKYKAKKALAASDNIDVSGVVRRKVFHSDKDKKDIEFISIVVYNPFEDGTPINMYIKNADAAAVFEMFCRERLNLYAEPGESLAG
jgi:hypothetical protein